MYLFSPTVACMKTGANMWKRKTYSLLVEMKTGEVTMEISVWVAIKD